MNKKARRRKYWELQELETVDTKACSVCLKIKPLSNFSPCPTGRKGLLAKCKACMRDYSRKKQPGKYDAQTIKYLELRDQEKGDRKVCRKCLKFKALSAFYSHKNHRKGCSSVCKKCLKESLKARYNSEVARRKGLKQKYGLTVGQYDKMLKNQDGCCAICGTDTPGHNGRFVVDHCHKTGKIRALLCSACNSGLGFFKDDPNVLRLAARYLEKHDE